MESDAFLVKVNQTNLFAWTGVKTKVSKWSHINIFSDEYSFGYEQSIWTHKGLDDGIKATFFLSSLDHSVKIISKKI